VTTKVGEQVSREKMTSDIEAIMRLGWFVDATVRIEGVAEGTARLVFIVVENPVITEVVVEGNTVISSEEIVRTLNVPTGEVLNTIRVREGARAVERLYEGRGYVLARVSDVGVVSAGNGRLTLRLSEGRLEAVEFKGLRKTRPEFARRFITLRAGDVFNIHQLNRDLRRLFDLQFYEQVQARPRPGSQPDTVVLEIEVKEAQTGRIGVGLGFSSEAGLVGQLELSDRNWKGRGQFVALRAERGFSTISAAAASRFSFSLDFREPFLDDRETALALSLFSSSADLTEVSITTGGTIKYTLDRIGSFAELSRPIGPATTASVRLRSEQAKIFPDTSTPDSEFDAVCLREPGCRTVSILLRGTRDTRDHPLVPTRGDRQSLSLEFGLPLLGGQFSFQKYFAEYIQYISMGGETHLAGRVQVGLGTGNIPRQEEYSLGGPITLRGFPAGQFRGDSMLMANLEYRTPLGGIASFLRDFTGIVFVDTGTAPIGGPQGFKTNFGLGVAFKTPLGVIRIDYATGPAGNQTWLNLGHPF
jgi:outer membrane protein insertion porin family